VLTEHDNREKNRWLPLAAPRPDCHASPGFESGSKSVFIIYFLPFYFGVLGKD